MNTITQQQFKDRFGDGYSEFSIANPGPYYRGLCLERDRSVLIALSRHLQPKIILEIGVQWGWLAKVLLHESSWIEHYIGVDILPDTAPELGIQKIELPREDVGVEAKGDKRFELKVFPKGSHELTADNMDPADFIFIDGDHSYYGVLQDSRLALDLIRPGGVIVWHDYGNSSVEATKAIDDWDRTLDGRLIQVQGTATCFEIVEG